MDSLIRIHSADYDELMEYQRKLLDNLNEGAVLTVTTKNGTRIGFKAQGWNVDSTEVNTSPTTESFSGRIVYDGSLFYGRPAHLVTVVVDMGQILNLNCEDPDDEQFTMFRNCMNTDPGAAAIAEFGIGLNPTADPFGHGMEAEMSRRTCHVDFGNAMPFGGQNRSAIHYGGTVFEPTIGVDGKEIMRSGVLVGLKDVV